MSENRRTRMTKMMMKEALLDLLEKRTLDKISVTEICRCADVNRSSFYAYYEDPRQLLEDIKQDVVRELPPSPEGSGALTEDDYQTTLEQFFNYIQENKRLFRILIILRDDSRFVLHLLSIVMEKAPGFKETGDDPIDHYSYVYHVSGAIGMIKEWIGSDCPIPSGDFAKIVLKITLSGTFG